MMTIEYSKEELAFMESRTIRLDSPVPPLNTHPSRPKRHALAGRTPGVRSTSRQALKKVNLSKDENQVLVALTMHDHSMCDRELLHYLRSHTDKGAKWDINQVNGRRNGLLTKGRIEEDARWKCDYSHSTVGVIHWKVVTAEAQG